MAPKWGGAWWDRPEADATAKRRASTVRPRQNRVECTRSSSVRRPRKHVHHPEPVFPKPDRWPPFVLEGQHDFGEEYDVDWTVADNPEWKVEVARRYARNKLIKAQLREGKNAAYRSSGWSLHPRVSSGDCCTYAPVNAYSEILVGDIVFCEVMPGFRFFAHLVKDKEWDQGHNDWVYTISNKDGKENGWCYIETIYGKLIETTK